MKTLMAPRLSRSGAFAVLNGALGKAEQVGASVSIAVVDDAAHLLAFARTDEAELYSIAISMAKGRSSALTRFPSGKKSPSGNVRDDHHALAITLAAGPGSFVTIPGGLPIFHKGKIVGAIGVSGAGHSDVEIAEAGVAAFSS
ncbi:MAG: GlcG/HbpS family heme-binding protein [Candidatus Binatia bacterium]